MVLFGIDNGLKLAVIVKTTVVPMTIHTQQAVTSVPLREAAKVMNFSRWQRLRWLVIPQACRAGLPACVWRYRRPGCRLSLSSCWPLRKGSAT
jgi:sulfonate transport system permease protein